MIPPKDPKQTSDDAFMWFLFVIVTMVVSILYLIEFFRLSGKAIEWIRHFFGGKSRRRYYDDDDESTGWLTWLLDYILYIPKTVFSAVVSWRCLFDGIAYLTGQPYMTFRVFFPKFLKFCLKPRKSLLTILWLVLLSSVLYNKLTYDGHAVLGVAPDATIGEIKKAYRTLSKRYHPDQDPSQEARAIYFNIRKAYKSLVDVETFEKEAQMEDISINVALPSFLTSRRGSRIFAMTVPFGLLGLIVWIWRRYGVSNFEKAVQEVGQIQRMEDALAPLYRRMAIPEERKMTLRRRDRELLKQMMKKVGATLTPWAMEAIPSVEELKRRVQHAETHSVSLAQWGLDERQVEELKKLLDGLDLEAAAQSVVDPPPPNFRTVKPHEWKTAIYFFEHVTQSIHDQGESLCETLRVLGLPQSPQKLVQLERHHTSVLDKLAYARAGKYAGVDQTFLAHAECAGYELSRQIFGCIDGMLSKAMREWQRRRFGGRRH